MSAISRQTGSACVSTRPSSSINPAPRAGVSNSLAGGRGAATHLDAREAGRGESQPVGSDGKRLVAVECGKPFRTFPAHGKGRGRVAVGEGQAPANDREADEVGGRAPRVWVDDVFTALIRARRRAG